MGLPEQPGTGDVIEGLSERTVSHRAERVHLSPSNERSCSGFAGVTPSSASVTLTVSRHERVNVGKRLANAGCKPHCHAGYWQTNPANFRWKAAVALSGVKAASRFIPADIAADSHTGMRPSLAPARPESGPFIPTPLLPSHLVGYHSFHENQYFDAPAVGSCSYFFFWGSSTMLARKPSPTRAGLTTATTAEARATPPLRRSTAQTLLNSKPRGLIAPARCRMMRNSTRKLRF